MDAPERPQRLGWLPFSLDFPRFACAGSLPLLAALLVLGALAGGLVARAVSGAPQDLSSLAHETAIGRIIDREGSANCRPVGATRWMVAAEQAWLETGEWVRTGTRGANAVAVRLSGGAELVLGPGGLVELLDGARVKLSEGELEVSPSREAHVRIDGPGGARLSVSDRRVVSARGGTLRLLEEDPRWLSGYKEQQPTEALGSLLATIDGRNVPLTIGDHKVTVDIRDQIARTEIEESFINHTDSVLEGVFYFPLPADASISGFGMWVGDELVHGEIVEKQRARQIYETILREKRDPGLLEWTGGNIFKARVYPITGRKRIKISYTQVLPKAGTAYAYHYALQSEMLRQHPLERLEIAVTVSSVEEIDAVTSPSHECRIRTTAHAASVEFVASEFTPDRDFELRVRTRPAPGSLTFIPHKRADDGYFMLLVNAPEQGAAPAGEAAAPASRLDLLVLADTSGSMVGAARDSQIQFIEALLGSLADHDSFLVATCDTEVRWQAADPRANSAEHREAALRFIEECSPLGWSDLDRAFAQVMERVREGMHVVYVGDGIITTGDADPNAFAARLARLYAGRGTFHAVAPGSSYERVVLQSMARLGNGTSRVIGGDPASTASGLLRDITMPTLERAELTFEGVAAAAVYPESLPRLAAGAQQIVVGRFDTSRPDQRGSVTLSGTLGGERVTLRGEVSLAEADQGNSFIPRLWARQHLDHLLAQGSSATITERIIALSEEFQIITPHTSFLVLESEEDRERFGVEKRLRMRDAEEFFAEGREEAREQLLARQMREAKRWRQRLQATLLQELAGMNRDLTNWLRAEDRQREDMERRLASLGYTSGSGGDRGLDEYETNLGVRPSKGRYHGEGDSVSPVDYELESMDFGEPPYERAAWDVVERPADGDYEYAADTTPPGIPGGPGTPGPGAGPGTRVGGFARRAEAASPGPGSESAGKYLLGAGERKFAGRDDDDAPRSWYGPERPSQDRLRFLPERLFGGTGAAARPLGALFPVIPDPQRLSPRPAWPNEVGELVALLDHRRVIEKGDTAFRISSDWTGIDHRGQRYRAGTVEALLARDMWLTDDQLPRTTDGTIEWLFERERGIITTGWRLGRARKAVEGDEGDWTPRLSWVFADDLVRQYGKQRASRRDLEDGRIELTFHSVLEPENVLVVIVDAARSAVLEVRSSGRGKLLSSHVFSDFAEVGGAWWPGFVRITDERSKAASEVRITVTALDRAAFEAAMRKKLEVCTAGLVLGDPPEDLAAAKQAIADGKAGVEDQWLMILHHASRQEWEAARPYLEAVATAARGPAPGALLIAFASASRRLDELKVLLETLAVELVAAGSERGVLFLADSALQYGANLARGGEMLGLLQTLEPVYRAHADYPAIVSRYEERVVDALLTLRRHEEAFARGAQMAEDHPGYGVAQASYAMELAGRGDVDKAVAHLEGAERRGAPWLDVEVEYLRSTSVDILWNSRRLEEIVQRVERWEREDPEHASVAFLDRYLTALLMLGREGPYTTLIERWQVDARKPELTALEEAHLEAAVRHALGRGWNLYRSRLDEAQARVLAASALAFARHATLHRYTGEIIGDRRFRHTDEARGVLRELSSMLETGVETMPLPELHRFVTWIREEGFIPGDGQSSWDKVMEWLFARWSSSPNDEAVVLGQLLVRYGGRAVELRLRRAWFARLEDAAEKRDAAFALLRVLFDDKWSGEVENELAGLVRFLAVSGGDARSETERHREIIALHDFADWMVRARTAALLAALPDVNSMSRQRLKTERSRAMEEARAAAAQRLAGLEEVLAPQELGAWAALDRVYLDVKRRKDLSAAREKAHSLLDAVGATVAQAQRDPSRRHVVLGARCSATLLYLLTLSAEAERAEQEASLRALLDERIEKRDELLDWKQIKVTLLMALDRADQLQELLNGWFGGGETFAAMRWGKTLAMLRAERGRLQEAVDLMKQVEQNDELDHRDYRALAEWYTALGNGAAARAARIASWQALDEWRIVKLLQPSLPRPDEPSGLGPEVPVQLIALMRKSTQPVYHLGFLARLYRSTKDFRVLECLGDAVIGHSAGGIYRFLEGIARFTELIQEEATVDRLADHLAELQVQAKSDTDRRALHLLRFSAQSRAAAQAQGGGPHAAAALEALRLAAKGAWEEGEPPLMAAFLARQGKLSDSALAAEQLRQLQALSAVATRGSEAHLTIALHLAATLREYGRLAEATRRLEAALRDARGITGRSLPESANEALETYARYLQEGGEFARAEQVWLEELAKARTEMRRQWLRQRAYQNYHKALAASAEVSLGRDRELYEAVQDVMLEDLSSRTDERHALELVNVLCSLWRTCHQRFPDGTAAEDLRLFAFSKLPRVLGLYAHRGCQPIIGAVSSCLLGLLGPFEQLQFLVERAENEPSWLGYARQDFWEHHAWTLAAARAKLGTLRQDLAERVLAIVERELSEAMRTREIRGGSIFHKHHDHFWKEKAQDFAEAAISVAGAHPDSEGIALFVADYLARGLEMTEKSIDLLEARRRRGALSDSGLLTLCGYLREVGRWQELLPLATGLVARQPENIDHHVMLMRALHGVGRQRDVAAALQAAKGQFRKAERWNEENIAELADACRVTELNSDAAALYAEAIALHVKSAPDRGVGDSVLDRYYREQSLAYAALGRLSEAVEAAAGAIICWPAEAKGRALALDNLRHILQGAKDIDAYAASVDAEVERSGLENPLLRKMLGQVYLEKGDLAKAVRQLRVAVASQPDDIETHRLLVRAFDAQHEPDLALAELETLAEVSGHDIAVYREMGERLEGLERPGLAERAYTTIVEWLYSEAQGHQALAEIRERQERLPEAELEWRQVIRLRSDEPTGYLGLARLLMRQDRPGEAGELIRALLGRTWPDHFGDVHAEARKLSEELRGRSR
ncbi:MAG: VIT domain-containing protein [Planctomycetota bacterium]